MMHSGFDLSSHKPQSLTPLRRSSSSPRFSSPRSSVTARNDIDFGMSDVDVIPKRVQFSDSSTMNHLFALAKHSTKSVAHSSTTTSGNRESPSSAPELSTPARKGNLSQSLPSPNSAYARDIAKANGKEQQQRSPSLKHDLQAPEDDQGDGDSEHGQQLSGAIDDFLNSLSPEDLEAFSETFARGMIEDDDPEASRNDAPDADNATPDDAAGEAHVAYSDAGSVCSNPWDTSYAYSSDSRDVDSVHSGVSPDDDSVHSGISPDDGDSISYYDYDIND